MTGKSDIYNMIDSLHSKKAQHPSHRCGPYFRVMYNLGSMLLDDPAAERVWHDLRQRFSSIGTMRGGLKTFVVLLVDHHRNAAKVFGVGEELGVLQGMLARARTNRALQGCRVAYDSLARFVYCCAVCGSKPGLC